MFRLILGLPVAAGITVALFLLMRYLILVEYKPQEELEGASIDITRPERDEDANRRDRNKPDRPEQADAPPPPPPLQINSRVDPANLNSNMNLPDFSVDVGGLDAPTDRTAIPLVTVPPIYPDRAASRGIEGWVVVEFDITPAGTVENPRVIDALPSGTFDNAALKAIRRWKFKPQIVNGQPVAQYNKEYQITFQLDQ